MWTYVLCAWLEVCCNRPQCILSMSISTHWLHTAIQLRTYVYMHNIICDICNICNCFCMKLTSASVYVTGAEWSMLYVCGIIICWCRSSVCTVGGCVHGLLECVYIHTYMCVWPGCVHLVTLTTYSNATCMFISLLLYYKVMLGQAGWQAQTKWQ